MMNEEKQSVMRFEIAEHIMGMFTSDTLSAMAREGH